MNNKEERSKITIANQKNLGTAFTLFLLKITSGDRKISAKTNL